MCGGKKEKKPDAPLPEPLPEAPPAEEPKGTGSVKSMGSKMSDSETMAAQPSFALMTGRKGGVATGLPKGPAGAESMAIKGAPSLMLTSGRAPAPKGGTSAVFGGKSAAKR